MKKPDCYCQASNHLRRFIRFVLLHFSTPFADNTRDKMTLKKHFSMSCTITTWFHFRSFHLLNSSHSAEEIDLSLFIGSQPHGPTMDCEFRFDLMT